VSWFARRTPNCVIHVPIARWRSALALIALPTRCDDTVAIAGVETCPLRASSFNEGCFLSRIEPLNHMCRLVYRSAALFRTSSRSALLNQCRSTIDVWQDNSSVLQCFMIDRANLPSVIARIQQGSRECAPMTGPRRRAIRCSGLCVLAGFAHFHVSRMIGFNLNAVTGRARAPRCLNVSCLWNFGKWSKIDSWVRWYNVAPVNRDSASTRANSLIERESLGGLSGACPRWRPVFLAIRPKRSARRDRNVRRVVCGARTYPHPSEEAKKPLPHSSRPRARAM